RLRAPRARAGARRVRLHARRAREAARRRRRDEAWSPLPGATPRLALRRALHPAAAFLALAGLGTDLASRTGAEELAGIDPVLGDRPRENGAQLAVEIREIRAAMVPEGLAIRHL